MSNRVDNSELISIIVPVYKVAEYLCRCIDSLIDQTYENIEIILVDDGSPDACPGICDEYARINSKIRVFHKENGGLSSARNYGVTVANGNLIVFVDSDDYVENEYIYDLYNLLTSFDADVAITRIIREDAQGKRKTGLVEFNDQKISPEQAFIEVYSGTRIGWEAYGKIYKKDLLLNNPFPNGLYEDFGCQYKILKDADSIAIGNYEKNYHYVTRPDSILTTEFNKKHLQIFDLCNEMNAYIESYFPEHDYLSYLLYERGIIQIFKLHTLSKNVQKNIYKKYKRLFRSGFYKIVKSKHVSIRSKYYALVLCLGLEPYRIGERVISFIREMK